MATNYGNTIAIVDPTTIVYDMGYLKSSQFVSVYNPIGWVPTANFGQSIVSDGSGAYYVVKTENAARLYSAFLVGLGNPEISKILSEDKSISGFSVRDPETGTLTPWVLDPRKARALQLGYGDNPTPEMLDAADQGIPYEDWRATKIRSVTPSTPGGTAIQTLGVGGPTGQPTTYPIPTMVRPPVAVNPAELIAPQQNTVASVKPGPENEVEQTPTGGVALNLDSLKAIPMAVWVVVGVLIALFVLRKK